MARPIIVSSSCLEFEKVHYSGQVMSSKIVRDLMIFADFKPVCPETGIGLGTPRDPVRIVRVSGQLRLIQPAAGLDITDKMNDFTNTFLASIGEVDGFIFNEKSPSMGISSIKEYAAAEKTPAVESCSGYFADKIIKTYHYYPIEVSDRLRNRRIRDHFLTHLFLFASFREHRQQHQLAVFHKANRLLFQYYNSHLAHALDDTDPWSAEYASLMHRIMIKPPSVDAVAAFYRHLLPKTSLREAADDAVRKFEENTITRETLREIFFLALHETEMASQTLFNSYPEPLRAGAEEDRGKDYWK